jgi:hypothetical protein
MAVAAARKADRHGRRRMGEGTIQGSDSNSKCDKHIVLQGQFMRPCPPHDTFPRYELHHPCHSIPARSF